MSVSALAALFVSSCGVLAALCAAIAMRDPRAGLPMLLELWTAAALLQLTASDTWGTLAVVSLLLLVRLLVSRGRHRALSRRLRPPVSP